MAITLNVIIFVITLVSLQETAFTLNCYYCAGPTKSECGRGIKSTMVTTECQAINNDLTSKRNYESVLNKMNIIEHTDEIQVVCVQLVYPVNEVPIFARSCAALPNVAPACDLLKQIVNATHCKSCETDLCNTSPYI